MAEWTATLYAELARTGSDFRCFACKGPLEEPLRDVGSLRCLDCRDARAPLDSDALAPATRSWTPGAWPAVSDT